jgi:hypothetical protein
MNGSGKGVNGASGFTQNVLEKAIFLKDLEDKQ